MKRIRKALCILICTLIFSSLLCGVSASAEGEFEKIRDVYIPDTLIVNPPTVVQMIDGQEKLNDLQSQVRPQCAWLQLSAEDHQIVLGQNKIALTQALDACDGKVIPIIEIPNATAAEYVIKTVKDQYYDLIFASMDTEVLELMNDAAIPYSRLAYISDSQNPTEVAEKALSCGAMIVVQKKCVRNNAEYFQQRFLTVMLMPEAENDELAVRAAVDCGANFVVTDGFQKAYEMYAAVTRVSYIRKGYIVGHRCMVSAAPENTVEGLHEAFLNGADAVEIDIWRTTDDQLVCFHNNNLSGSTTVEPPYPTKPINEYSLEELQAFTLKQKGEYFDCKIPTLDQMFAALKEYPDKMMVIEIKDHKKTGELVHALMEEYGVAEQCVFISFGAGYLRDQQEYNPTVGTSLLTSATWEDPLGYVNHYYQYSVGLPTSYSPSKSISVEGIQQLHVRGVAVNLWTAYRLGEMTDMAYHGAQFITTDVVEEESWVRPFYTRMNANDVFGKYQTAAEEAPADNTVLIIVIAAAGVLLCSGAAAAIILTKRKKK